MLMARGFSAPRAPVRVRRSHALPSFSAMLSCMQKTVTYRRWNRARGGVRLQMQLQVHLHEATQRRGAGRSISTRATNLPS